MLEQAIRLRLVFVASTEELIFLCRDTIGTFLKSLEKSQPADYR